MTVRGVALLILAGVLVSAPCRGDVIPYIWGPCEGKKLGDDCTTDRGEPGQCNDADVVDSGPTNKWDAWYRQQGSLQCNTKWRILGENLVGTLSLGFAISFVMVGTGLFLVRRRRRRAGS